jgi:AcrR family transcriptional regulator
MPKLKPDIQRARREHILEAAELCFARSGFHRTTMQDICREASVSPGALYVYFDNKEALIAGICERDRADFAERFAALAAAPDFLAALAALGEEYFVNEPAHKRRMCVEIGLESTRNPRVAEIFQRIDGFIHDSFQRLFQQLKDEGRIDPALDIPSLTRAFAVITDGMFWQRAVDPTFDPKAVMPTVLQLLSVLLNPVPAPSQATGDPRSPHRD